MQKYDPFKQMKYKAFDESETTMIAIATFLIFQFSKNDIDEINLKVLFLQMLKVFFILLILNILGNIRNILKY